MADDNSNSGKKENIRQQQRFSKNISSVRTQQEIQNPPKNQNLGLKNPDLLAPVPFGAARPSGSSGTSWKNLTRAVR